MTRKSTKAVISVKSVEAKGAGEKERGVLSAATIKSKKNRAEHALLVKEVAGAEALRSFFSTGQGHINRKILDPRYLILSYLTYLTIVSYNLILY